MEDAARLERVLNVVGLSALTFLLFFGIKWYFVFWMFGIIIMEWRKASWTENVYFSIVMACVWPFLILHYGIRGVLRIVKVSLFNQKEV